MLQYFEGKQRLFKVVEGLHTKGQTIDECGSIKWGMTHTEY